MMILKITNVSISRVVHLLGLTDAEFSINQTFRVQYDVHYRVFIENPTIITIIKLYMSYNEIVSILLRFDASEQEKRRFGVEKRPIWEESSFE